MTKARDMKLSWRAVVDGRHAGLWVMVALLGLAFGLRSPTLDGPRFLPDEALFASFARSIAVWRDPLLAAAPVDKPPLLFYLQALCYPFLGPKEMAARLPNLFASLLTVAITYRVTRGLTRTRQNFSAILAAFLVALSPLAVAFGSTAFTDPLMVAWGMGALLAASGGRAGWAGISLGLGLATKYQAAFFLPLVAGVLRGHVSRSGARPESAWLRFGGGFLLPLAAVAAWELGRSGGFALLGIQWASYGGVRLLRPGEFWPRLAEWAELARYLVDPVWIGLALLTLVLPALVIQRRDASAGLLLGGWLGAYFLFHWLLNINPWDRYLLPIVPVAATLLGWSAGDLAYRFLSGKAQLALTVLLCLLLLPAAIQAADGAFPIGGDHGSYDGIEQVAKFFADSPYGTVLYDHWLSWELRYYLFDSRVYTSWFPDAAALVRDLEAFGVEPPRYLVVPAWQDANSIIEYVRGAGFALRAVLCTTNSNSTSSFIVYTITH